MLQEAPPPRCTPTPLGSRSDCEPVRRVGLVALFRRRTRKKGDGNDIKRSAGARDEGSPKGEWITRVASPRHRKTVTPTLVRRRATLLDAARCRSTRRADATTRCAGEAVDTGSVRLPIFVDKVQCEWHALHSCDRVAEMSVRLG